MTTSTRDLPLMIGSADELEAVVGTTIGPAEWLLVEQDRIDAFAECTEDRQWVHVDPQRAESGPFGTTIAHGFLTLSLVPRLVADLRRLDNVVRGINYGLNSVRFITPVPAGSRIRGRLTFLSSERISAEAVQLVSRVTVELEGVPKPACVCEMAARYYFG
jgi:acyl dehydratase